MNLDCIWKVVSESGLRIWWWSSNRLPAIMTWHIWHIYTINSIAYMHTSYIWYCMHKKSHGNPCRHPSIPFTIRRQTPPLDERWIRLNHGQVDVNVKDYSGGWKIMLVDSKWICNCSATCYPHKFWSTCPVCLLEIVLGWSLGSGTWGWDWLGKCSEVLRAWMQFCQSWWGRTEWRQKQPIPWFDPDHTHSYSAWDSAHLTRH